MKKRRILYVLFCVLVLGLAACGRSVNEDLEPNSNHQESTNDTTVESNSEHQESTNEDSVEPDSNTQEDSGQGRTTSNIAQALLEESKFWLVPDDDTGARQATLNEIEEEIEEKFPNKTLTITMLQVDLENDGTDEVILQFGVDGNRYVFHDLDGEVYAYEVSYRGMKKITVDKVINGSSSAAVGGFYKVVGFTSMGIVTEQLFGTDEISGPSESYYYKGDGEKREIISDEEYRELLATFTQAGKLIFKEFRAENIVY